MSESAPVAPISEFDTIEVCEAHLSAMIDELEAVTREICETQKAYCEMLAAGHVVAGTGPGKRCVEAPDPQPGWYAAAVADRRRNLEHLDAVGKSAHAAWFSLYTYIHVERIRLHRLVEECRMAGLPSDMVLGPAFWALDAEENGKLDNAARALQMFAGLWTDYVKMLRTHAVPDGGQTEEQYS